MLLSSFIAEDIAKGINKIRKYRHKVKIEKPLRSLLNEINPLLEQGAQHESQGPSAVNDIRYKENNETEEVAHCSKYYSEYFSIAAKPKLADNNRSFSPVIFKIVLK